MDKKSVVAVVVVLILSAGLSYEIGASKYQKELKMRMERITQLEKSLKEARAAAEEAASMQAQAPAGGEKVNCLACHELGQTKSFHVPQTIMKIDARDGKRRRTCVDCHGPLGPPWSADKQMTPLSLLFYNESKGPNGVIEITSEVPHSIHKRKLDAGVMKCQTCHGSGVSMVIPEPDTSRGHVLVCQNCKYHPEDGNYIAIHVELAGKECTICHTGGVIKVHQEKTRKLGQV